MKTVTEMISKPSEMPLKKNGGMVTLFHPVTEEIRDFWPVNAREAMKNGWQPKPEKVLLMEVPRAQESQPAPTIMPAAPAPVSSTPPVEESVPSSSFRKSRRGYASEPSDTK